MKNIDQKATMGVVKFLTSAGIMILGFFINQLGLYVILRQPTWIVWLPQDLFGMALEFGGGLLLIFGFIMFISNALSESVLREGPVTRKASRVSALKNRLMGSTVRCKFCGAEISKDALFCPVCQKSQR